MMMTMLTKTEEKIKEIISRFIKPEDYRFFIFGSRVMAKARKFSDYDIGIAGKKSLPLAKMAFRT